MGLRNKLSNMRREASEKINVNPQKMSKLRRIVTSIAIIGSFIAVGFLVLQFTKSIQMSTTAWEFVCIVAILCITSLTAVPWIERLERKQDKILSIVMLSMIGFCLVLWIVDIFVAFNLVNLAKSENFDGAIATINFLKVSLIITIQFLTISAIAGFFVKYKRNYIAYQVIAYLSNLYVDFYLTCLILTVSISNSKDPIKFNGALADFLFKQKAVWVLFILAFVFMILANSIANKMQEKRIKRNDIYRLNKLDEEEIARQDGVYQESTPETNEEKLEKLKKMFDKNLITKEEYEAKRKEIIDKM